MKLQRVMFFEPVEVPGAKAGQMTQQSQARASEELTITDLGPKVLVRRKDTGEVALIGWSNIRGAVAKVVDLEEATRRPSQGK